MEGLGMVQVLHAFREANKVADIMAKKAAFQDDAYSTYRSPPNFVMSMLSYDA